MRIFTKETINQMSLDEWKKDAIGRFEAKMTDVDKPFPCIPSTQGFQLNRFRYGFLSNPYNPSTSEELSLILEDYSKSYREIGNYTSLIIFYKPFQNGNKNESVEQYEQLFWAQLNRISELDTTEWPNHIPSDPHDPLWEFCFQGEPYFMYCATPSHKNRMSRHFPYLMLAITPRRVLEGFNSSQSHAQKIKSKIRTRLADYDSIPIHPDLNTYGQMDNYEWKQYFLHDDHTTTSECPFHKFSKTNLHDPE